MVLKQFQLIDKEYHRYVFILRFSCHFLVTFILW